MVSKKNILEWVKQRMDKARQTKGEYITEIDSAALRGRWDAYENVLAYLESVLPDDSKNSPGDACTLEEEHF